MHFFFLSVQFSQLYIATDHTSAFISCIFLEIGMLWLFHIFCTYAPIACFLFNLVRNSVIHSPSSVIRDPRYGNIFTCSSCSFWMSATRYANVATQEERQCACAVLVLVVLLVPRTWCCSVKNEVRIHYADCKQGWLGFISSEIVSANFESIGTVQAVWTFGQ